MELKLELESSKKEKLEKRKKELELELSKTINSYQSLIINLEKQNQKQGHTFNYCILILILYLAGQIATLSNAVDPGIRRLTPPHRTRSAMMRSATEFSSNRGHERSISSSTSQSVHEERSRPVTPRRLPPIDLKKPL